MLCFKNILLQHLDIWKLRRSNSDGNNILRSAAIELLDAVVDCLWIKLWIKLWKKIFFRNI